MSYGWTGALGLALLVGGCTSADAGPPQRPRVVPAAEGRAIPGTDPRLRLEGRFLPAADGPRFAWPGTTVHLRFVGTRLDVRLLDTPFEDAVKDLDRIGVRIDGGPLVTITLREGEETYRLAENLPRRRHDVAIIKLTEAEQGTITLRAISTDGRLEQAKPARERRLLVIGDSISAGFGIDGADCHYDARYANAARTWAFLAADTLGAERQIVAWSGRGLVWNYDRELEDALPELMKRTIPSDETSTFDPSSFRPQAIVINVGTNDVSRREYDRGRFARAYLGLIDDLRDTYGNVRIVVAFGPLISDDYPRIGTGTLRKMRTTLEGVVQRRARGGDTNVRLLELPGADGREGYGCDQHPSATTHERLAGLLVNALADVW